MLLNEVLLGLKAHLRAIYSIMPKGSIRSFAHVDGHIYIELRVESILDAILVWGF